MAMKFAPRKPTPPVLDDKFTRDLTAHLRDAFEDGRHSLIQQRINEEALAEPKLTPAKIEKLHQEIAKLHPTVKPDGRFKSKNKTRITLWLDNDALEYFRAKGPGWQTEVNKALRAMMEASK